MMITRILTIAAAGLILCSSTASAQGRPRQQVAISPSVLKSITAQKQKSKTPLMTRVGVHRAPATTVLATGAAHAPASVRAIKKAPIIK